jgi:hypothetical protein
MFLSPFIIGPAFLSRFDVFVRLDQQINSAPSPSSSPVKGEEKDLDQEPSALETASLTASIPVKTS